MFIDMSDNQVILVIDRDNTANEVLRLRCHDQWVTCRACLRYRNTMEMLIYENISYHQR